MGWHPTTSLRTAGRDRHASLGQRLRAWRERPRKLSPPLYWALLATGALLDAAAVTLVVGLLAMLAPASTGHAIGPPSWFATLAAAAVVAAGWAMKGRWPRLGHAFLVAGLAGAITATTLAARQAGQDMAAWAACLAAVIGAGLEVSYRRGVLALAGTLAASLLLLLVGRPSLTALLGPEGEGWHAARRLALAGGLAGLATTWIAANLALALTVASPLRRGSIRTLADGAYRALVLAVCLFAVAALLGGVPRGGPHDIIPLAAVVALGLLLHARFSGWVQDLGLCLGCVLGFLSLATATAILSAPHGTSAIALGWLCALALANLSLVVHAVHRHSFAQPLLSAPRRPGD